MSQEKDMQPNGMLYILILVTRIKLKQIWKKQLKIEN